MVLKKGGFGRPFLLGKRFLLLAKRFS